MEMSFFGNLKNESDGTANGIYLGEANDLQLYHDSNSIIANSNNSVNLILQKVTILPSEQICDNRKV